jgi:hypothetical protein
MAAQRCAGGPGTAQRCQDCQRSGLHKSEDSQATQVGEYLETRVADQDLIRIQSGQWIRIRNPDPDPGGQK